MPTFDLYLPRTNAPWRAKRRPIPRVAAAWLLLATWIERTRQRNALAGLNDHLLRDIRIRRLDAVRECGKPFGDRRKRLPLFNMLTLLLCEGHPIACIEGKTFGS